MNISCAKWRHFVVRTKMYQNRTDRVNWRYANKTDACQFPWQWALDAVFSDQFFFCETTEFQHLIRFILIFIKPYVWVWILIIKMRWSWDRPIFMIRIPILIRKNPHIEIAAENVWVLWDCYVHEWCSNCRLVLVMFLSCKHLPKHRTDNQIFQYERPTKEIENSLVTSLIWRSPAQGMSFLSHSDIFLGRCSPPEFLFFNRSHFLPLKYRVLCLLHTFYLRMWGIVWRIKSAV